MRRRGFLGVLGGPAAMLLLANAQQAERIRRISVPIYGCVLDQSVHFHVAHFFS